MADCSVDEIRDENSSESRDNLLSTERMVSSSPVMWPDQNSFADLDSVPSSITPNWLNEVEKEDKKMLTELASLTQQQLLEKIQALQTFAYHLGIQEAKQMRRGTCLQVFDSNRRNGHFNVLRNQPPPSMSTYQNYITTQDIPSDTLTQNQQN